MGICHTVRIAFFEKEFENQLAAALGVILIGGEALVLRLA